MLRFLGIERFSMESSHTSRNFIRLKDIQGVYSKGDSSRISGQIDSRHISLCTKS